MMLLLAVIIRLPYYFASTNIRGAPFAFTVNREALFMLEGSSVLSGKLPYLGYWDKSMPMGWFAYAFLMFVSQGSLTMLRIIASLYVALTGFVLFRALDRSHQFHSGVLAGFFYIVFVSFLPAGQSFMYETITGLPLAGILYLLFSPNKKRKAVTGIALLYTFCLLMLPAFIFLLPAIAVAMAMYFPFNRRLADSSDQEIPKSFLSGLMRYGASFIIHVSILLVPAFLFYANLYFVYQPYDKSDFFLKSLSIATFGLNNSSSGFVQMKPFSWAGFWQGCEDYFMFYMRSNYWLVPFLSACFMLRSLVQLVFDKGRVQAQNTLLLGLLLSAMCGVFFAGIMSLKIQHYTKQILPILCIVMAKSLTFKWRDAKLLLVCAVILGLWDVTKPLWNRYSLMPVISGPKIFNPTIFNDQQYRMAKIINTIPLKRHELFVCGDSDMLYVLTNTRPVYYYLPFDVNFSPEMQKKIGIRVADFKLVAHRLNPVFIVQKQNEPCLRAIDDIILLPYTLVSRIGEYAIYIRRDHLHSFK